MAGSFPDGNDSLAAARRAIRAVVCAVGLAGVAHANPAAAASPLALSCLGCHQPRVDARTMPALGRSSSGAIAASLKAARDAPVSGSIMARFAAGLSNAQIEALARELGRAE